MVPLTKTCACGTVFTGPPQRKKCRKNCSRTKDHNPKRTERRQANDITFIAVDGEGVDRPDGTHEYIMLSVGQDSLANKDGSRLTYDQIFTFLYDQYLSHPDAAFIGFFLGYDFDQWIRGFTEHEAFMLLTKQGIARRRRRNSQNREPFPVYVGKSWEVDMLGKRRFRLSPHVHHRSKGTLNDVFSDKNWDHCACGFWFHPPRELVIGDDTTWEELFPRNRKARHRMYICDTGPFWQQSFLKVVDPGNWTGQDIVTDDEYEILKQGKADRGIVADYGDTSYYDQMVRYNRLENKVLSKVTSHLNQGFMSIGIKVPQKEWYGPGRPAQIWLNKHVTPDEDRISHEAMEAHVPEYARNAWQWSYYGGWFEQFMHGHIGLTVYEYDINSAYPYIISRLPCLIHGVWSEGDGETCGEYEPGDLYLLRIESVGSDSYIGGLPHRSKTGHITHPQKTAGWYWKGEVDAAVNAGLIDSYTVHQWVRYQPCDCDPPLRDIADLYGKRIGAGIVLTESARNALKNGPSGKAYKCVYNSAYGKFAQSIGNPRYGNPIYASLITAGCRALILSAIATHPERSKAVTMIATDGIYFTSPHPMKTDPYTLGAWDVSVITGMTQFMPGIYWNDTTRNAIRSGKAIKLKSRGISARDLANSIDVIDGMYNDIRDGYTEHDGNVRMAFNWPSLELKVEFALVSCLQAVIRGKWETAANVIHDGIRVIDSNPRTKRRWDYAYVDENGNLRTHPYEMGMVRGKDKAIPQLESTPYSKQFGFTDDNDLGNTVRDMGIIMDGDVGDLFASFMRG